MDDKFFFDRIACSTCCGSTHSTKCENEDAAAFSEEVLVLMDGATVVNDDDNHCLDGASDAAWLSDRACSVIVDRLRMYRELGRVCEIDQVVLKVLSDLKEEYEYFIGHDLSSDVTPGDVPSSTLSCVYISGNTLEVVQLGDSPVSIRLNNGKVLFFAGDSALIGFSKANKRKLAALHSGNMGVDASDAFSKIKHGCYDIRKFHCNTGYAGDYQAFCFAGMEKLNVSVISFNIDEVSSVCIYSDGYADLLDYDVDLSFDRLHDMSLNLSGQKEALDLLKMYQDSDPDCILYPRFKQSDDATVIGAVVAKR